MAEMDGNVDSPSSENPTEWISKPRISSNSAIKSNILEFDYSFGYNAKKLFNLCLLDSNTLVFASGNLLHFFNIATKEMTFRRSALGGGIGSIIKNPNPEYNYLTVAENGEKPPIIIYAYPSLEIKHVLIGGATRCFTHMDYNKSGELLASQAGEPDYMLTIWNWMNNQIILRTQSFQNDVLNVVFSPYNPSQLTTCGLGHIKFWKMNETFTGLKLQGELGRFGKTEICDIYAIYPLPDEKVISGCAWGNMLVWDAGLIKVEVCRKNRKPCHTAPITQISMMEGEVMTVGMDGYVRIWFWETVDLADPPEDDPFVEIEPIYEFRIGSISHLCELRHLIKKEREILKDYKFYAQDGLGGIWLCDLNPEETPLPPKQLFTCHEGAIVAAVTSPASDHIATLGEGGRLHLYNYKSRRLLDKIQYPAGGRDMIWMPPEIEPTASIVVAGFDDGVIRTILLETNDLKPSDKRFALIHAVKAHSKAITRISINPMMTILATASEDLTVFIHQLIPSSPFIKIVPIGFVTMSSAPSAINWRPRPKESSTIIIGCQLGHVVELDAPNTPQSCTENSYCLDHIQRKEFQFKSIKGELRRQKQIDAISQRKHEKKERKMAELKKKHGDDVTVDEDLEIYLEDSEPEEELEPLFYPKIPNRVLWLRDTPENTIWLSMGGYDAGYIYEFFCGERDCGLVRSTIISDGDDIEINAFFQREKYQIFGLKTGAIRVIAEKHDFRCLTDYWELRMHDNFNGRINAICSSYDNRYIFSMGDDGNLFSYKWNGDIPPTNLPQTKEPATPPKFADIDDRNALSLEEKKLKFLKDSQTQQANERKTKTLDILSEYKLQFKNILKLNRELPVSQQFTDDGFELDERITKDMIDELDDQLQLVRRKNAFDVEKATLGRNKVMEHFINPLQSLQITVAAIRSDNFVSSFRLEKLDEEFHEIKNNVDRMIQERKDNKWDVQYFVEKHETDISIPAQSNESFLQGLTTSSLDLRLDPKMKRLLDKHRYRKSQERARDLEKILVEAQRPDPNQNHPDDVRAIDEAKKNIGDYKLKTDPNYEPDDKQNTLTKYKEIIEAREELFNMQDKYNEKIFSLRSEKNNLYRYVEDKKEELDRLHTLLPHDKSTNFEPMPEINMDKEYPEEALKLTAQTSTGVEVKDIFTKRSDTLSGYIPRTENRLAGENAHAERQFFELESQVEFISFEDICAVIDENLEAPQDDEIDSREHQEQNLKHILTWPKELAFSSILRSLAEQNSIIQDIEYRVSKFDQKLEDLSANRYQIEIDAKFLDSFLITLNQELYILRDFERLEDDLVHLVESNVQKHIEMQSNIIRVRNTIDGQRKGIQKIVDQKKTIQNRFINSIKGNKFADFLTKIFNKKYKPPKETTANVSDESMSSSDISSMDDEDDSKSLESMDVAPLRHDENYCPPGCDRNLYDLTFELRTDRHLLEQKVYEAHRTIDGQKKQIEELNTNVKATETQLAANRDSLMELRREKQRYLNNVETVVVLKMEQMQHFREDSDVYNIDNTLLFNMSNVTKLHTRVGQLHEETEDAKQKHRINIVHLSRMKADCKHMEQLIARLRTEAEQAMVKKFGRVVNLDELEESVLRRSIFNLRTNIEDEKREADTKIAKEKELIVQLEHELIREMQIGTEKLNILTVLQEEKNYLHQLLQRQKDRLQQTTNRSERTAGFRNDLNRLKDIERQQQEQIEYLEKEIRGLRIKAKTFLSPDDTKTEPTVYNELLPPQDELCYEDYVYMAVQELTRGKDATSGQQSTDVFERINCVVGKHFTKTLSQSIDEVTLRKYIRKIAKHMAYVANNMERTQSMNVTECVAKFIQTTIPMHCHQHIKEDHIRKLFNDVVSIIRDTQSIINTKDIVAGIVSSVQENISQIDDLNITQEAVKEILKAMIEVLPVDEILNPEVIQQVARSLKYVENVNVRTLNFTQLSEDVISHARENLIETITLNVVKQFTDRLHGYMKK